jgi:hypothetical protein
MPKFFYRTHLISQEGAASLLIISLMKQSLSFLVVQKSLKPLTSREHSNLLKVTERGIQWF